MTTWTVAPPAFRLPSGLRLGAVRLQIADLAKSIDYYERVIGLRTLDRTATTARLGAKDDNATLVELHERRGAAPVPRRGRLGLYHFAILLPDRAALGRLLAHLTALGDHVGMADHLVSEALYLTDPDGLGIEVYADRPPRSWRVDGNTLAMASDPLNVPDLLAAAGEVAWTGPPRGTRIGHVHLYVADLSAATSFYHTALGFDTVLLNFPGAQFFSAGGYHHHVGTNTWAAGAPRAAETDARLLEWTIRVPAQADVEGAATSLASGGHTVRREAGDALAEDPWGIPVRISAAR
ncbi:MAG TPA: VOC family protein [Gemmatimonadaceae bacterium]|nr:VOC family protein [Gemmatimonadaceae bacterium]